MYRFLAKRVARYKVITIAFMVWAVVFLGACSQVCFSQEENDADTAVALFNQGQDAHEKGDLNEALKFYKKAIEIVPEFPEAELQLGNAFLSLGQIDDAERSFRKAVAHREDWTLALASLGAVLVTKRQYAEAEPLLTKALSLDDQNFPAISALTELRLNSKASTVVLADLLARVRSMTAKAKPTASIWAAQAALEFALKDKRSAKISYSKALELEPKNVSALSLKASIALEESDLTGASETVRIMESLVPNSQGTKVLRAKVLYASGKTDEAVTLLKEITDPAPEVAALAKEFALAGSVDAKVLEDELSKDPQNARILSRLCTTLRLADPQKALDYCRRASDAEPANIDHAIGYGAALVQAKMYLEAATLLYRLVEIAPDNSTIRANLATALFQAKHFAEATVQYRWLIEKQPGLAPAYYFLAISHDQLTEYLDAMANYQKFIRIADAEKNKLEIEKVNLRLPGLQKLIKDGKGKKTR